MKIRVMRDRVLVRKDKNSLGEYKDTGIMLPASATDLATSAEVVAVGPGFYDEKGKFHPQACKVGDRVLIGRYAGEAKQYFIGGENLYIIEQDLIQGIIEDDAQPGVRAA